MGDTLQRGGCCQKHLLITVGLSLAQRFCRREMQTLGREFCPFLSGGHEPSPRGRSWRPSWQDVSNACDVRGVTATRRGAALSSLALPRLLREQKPSPRHGLRVTVPLLWFISSELSSRFRKKIKCPVFLQRLQQGCNAGGPLLHLEKAGPLTVARAPPCLSRVSSVAAWASGRAWGGLSILQSPLTRSHPEIPLSPAYPRYFAADDRVALWQI